jgi:hypothetical protein
MVLVRLLLLGLCLAPLGLVVVVLLYGVSPSSSEFAGVKRFIGYVPEEFSFPGGLRGCGIVGYF